MLMTDDTGWNDFGAYTGGGAAPGHPTPNIDRIAKEGALFTSWYGQASCTAGRASFITGRIPIRSALSVVTVPGDLNGLRKETPTIAEFFKKNDYRGLRFRAGNPADRRGGLGQLSCPAPPGGWNPRRGTRQSGDRVGRPRRASGVRSLPK
jgi:hypothetical protein